MSGELLRIRTEQHDGRAVLEVAGEIDLTSASQLDTALTRQLLDTDRLVLDFSGVTFIDSSGLNVLVAAITRPGAPSDSVTIRNASERVVRLLTITGLDEVIHIEADVPSA